MYDDVRKTILLVEDEAILAFIKKKQLEKEGYSVLSVLSGEKALDLFGPGKPGIDLVLMDIDLGSGIDGIEAGRRILELADVPLLFLSSHAETEIRERVASIAHCGYVLKNAHPGLLETVLADAFSRFDLQEQR